jgi:hypothetical protein
VTDLSPIDPAAIPADVRNGSPERQKTYQGAMAFEQMLVEQLTSSLTTDASSTDDTTDGSGDGSSDDSGATTDTSGLGGPYASMLPSAFAQGIEAGGGLGLAEQITNSISPLPTAPAPGSTTAPATTPTTTPAAAATAYGATT